LPFWSLHCTHVQLAKALATIDQISGGRIIAGMGTGWSTDEFHATGATRADRGRCPSGRLGRPAFVGLLLDGRHL
jgi:hypothetical protein